MVVVVVVVDVDPVEDSSSSCPYGIKGRPKPPPGCISPALISGVEVTDPSVLPCLSGCRFASVDAVEFMEAVLC